MGDLFCSSQCITGWIQAISATVVAVAALMGLGTWKNNRKSDLENEVARNYFRAVLSAREAIRRVRNPFISIAEMAQAQGKEGGATPDLNNQRETDKSVYSKRWESVQSALAELDSVLLEAEVMWDQGAQEVQKEFREIVMELWSALHQAFFTPPEWRVKRQSAVIYEGYDSHGEGQDEYNKRLNASIAKIKKYLSPYISLNS